MRDKQERVKEHCDQRRGAECVFRVGDGVYVKAVRGELVSWQEAVVTRVVSAVTYVVKVLNRFRFVHADHSRSLLACKSTKVDDAETQENRIPTAEPAPSKLPMPSSDTNHEHAALAQPVSGHPAREASEHPAAERLCLWRLLHNPEGQHRLHLPLQCSVLLEALTTKRYVVARGFGSH
ncbi:hypothetical protein MTO96_052210 [Rhipicephalus appendiculatus]